MLSGTTKKSTNFTHSLRGKNNTMNTSVKKTQRTTARLRSVTGGRASRAEVYGLFIAAVVLVGGGVTGAIAYSSGDITLPTVAATETTPPSNLNTAGPAELSPETATGAEGGTTEPGSTTPVTPRSALSVETCAYTPAELAYYDSIRATKQQAVDYAQTEVNGTHAAIASNTAHLEELLAAPYRPIEVFQWHPDGTPAAYRVDSNEEIAFERQRILDNQSQLVRAEENLRRAIADRDLIPGC
ncbi:hypothetical protein AURMO_00266 [Aurantimicrobium photophilum]|uniref:Uncharacterized protein n=2 Tax=Aurantimicrobium photophilum TaxID=1987356 RepID=A0A2Z3RVE2_9MICO|nr:hypothetical protein AURMO_00266 [Aurantimicrobium photophilum]